MQLIFLSAADKIHKFEVINNDTDFYFLFATEWMVWLQPQLDALFKPTRLVCGCHWVYQVNRFVNKVFFFFLVVGFLLFYFIFWKVNEKRASDGADGWQHWTERLRRSTNDQLTNEPSGKLVLVICILNINKRLFDSVKWLNFNPLAQFCGIYLNIKFMKTHVLFFLCKINYASSDASGHTKSLFWQRKHT